MRIPAIEHIQQLQQHVSCNWAEKAGGSWNTRVACSGGRWFRVLAGYLYFGKWNSGTWWKISSLYRINASATWQLLAASANRKSQIWKFGWNNLPERNFMSTGAMGSSKLGHHLAKEKSQVVNVHPVSRFCHPSQVHYQHLKGGVDHWTIDLVQHNLH